MTDWLIDGRPGGEVSPDDRGLLYGDALFETIAFRAERAPLWDLHWQRLDRGCQFLGLNTPDARQLLTECQSLCAGHVASVIRLTLTRGSGGRGYWPPEPACSRRIIQRRGWPAGLNEQRNSGLDLVTSPVRLASGSILAGLKHGNRLEQVMAARACQQIGADEAVMLDNQGRVVEAISSNLLIELNGAIISPLADSGVDGVGLAWLRARLGDVIETAVLSERDLQAADAITVINSVAGIRPARSLDGRRLNPGSGCRLWQQLWNEDLS